MRTNDQGSGTIWVLALSALLLAVGAAAMVIAAGLTAHRRAASAADLTALAAASRMRAGDAAACSTAARVAAANDALLADCEVGPDSVLVAVRVDPPSPLIPAMEVLARAGYSSE
ncbi:MAG TPA: Rv3654c family TadE-like protein [Actinomycetes bacterium]|nr:Rv3654c family TadE-like protein [Actinomycetes bacterium]